MEETRDSGSGSGVNTILIVLLIVIVLAAAFFFYRRGGSPDNGGGANINVELPAGDAGSAPTE